MSIGINSIGIDSYNRAAIVALRRSAASQNASENLYRLKNYSLAQIECIRHISLHYRTHIFLYISGCIYIYTQ